MPSLPPCAGTWTLTDARDRGTSNCAEPAPHMQQRSQWNPTAGQVPGRRDDHTCARFPGAGTVGQRKLTSGGGNREVVGVGALSDSVCFSVSREAGHPLGGRGHEQGWEVRGEAAGVHTRKGRPSALRLATCGDFSNISNVLAITSPWHTCVCQRTQECKLDKLHPTLKPG